MTDPLTIRQATDNVFRLMQDFLHEPTDDNRQRLVTVMKHYLVQGYTFKLAPESVVCSRSKGGINA